MDKITIFLDSNGKLVSEYNGKMLSAKETHRFIQTFNQEKIIEITESKEKDNILLKYKDLNVYINGYINIFESYRTFKPVILNIKNYEERQACASTKIKKVVRKNKYKIEIMIVAGVVIVVLGGVVLGIESISAKTNDKTILESTTHIEYISEAPTQSNELKIKNKETGETTTYHMATGPTTIEETTQAEESEKQEVGVVELSYDNNVDDEKNTYTKENYSDLITKYSKMYGLDPNLMIALATQESGKHSTSTSGSAIGLMQLEKGIWTGASINVYNFEKKAWEKITLDESKFYDLEYNVKSACQIMQDSLNQQDYNILVGIQSYNIGPGNMKKVLNACAYSEGISKSSILKNQLSTLWLAYRHFADGGDKKYLEHLFQYLGDSFTISFQTPEGDTVSISVENKEKEKIY